MAEIHLEQLTKVFPGGVRAVDDVTLTIEDGEFLVLVGPSGCGKSTLLRLVAGLEEPSSGSIVLSGREITHVSARRRDIAMVFQNYALYPHMTVRSNLEYGLKTRHTPRREIAPRIDRVARMLGLVELLDRRPAQLSGGQRQRVAMGRAIVREPAAFLMDEPLSNLDAKLRVSMRAELARLHQRLGTTTVYVTHDQIEAMTLGQRVAVLRDGHIQQVDRPHALYAKPANLFVAAFIGSPSMNLVEASLSEGQVEFAGFRIPLHGEVENPNGRVILGVRPEAFGDPHSADPSLPRIDVEVSVVEDLGADAHVIFPIDAPRVELSDVKEAVEHDGEALLVDDRRALFTARIDARFRPRERERTELALDPSRFHFFDPSTRERLRLEATPLANLS